MYRAFRFSCFAHQCCHKKFKRQQAYVNKYKMSSIVQLKNGEQEGVIRFTSQAAILH